MKKPDKQLAPGEKEASDERMRELSREFDYDGKGAEVFLGSNDGKTETVSHFFTSRIPKLQIKSRNMRKTLEVEMSSVEEENQSLLHFLFKKSKDG